MSQYEASLDSKPTSLPVLESLQVLRAMAALIVVMIHVDGAVIRRFGERSLPQFVEGGYIGVDVFFCLSGFIMYYTMHGKFGVGRVVLGFLQRRFLRIYPIYWVATALTLLVGYWEVRLVEWRGLSSMMLAKSCLLFPQGVPPVLHQGWTLVHEVKFYLVFGSLLFLPWRRAAWVLWLWSLGSAGTLVVSMVGGDWLMGNGLGRAVNYLFHPANLEFASGVLAAWVVLNRRTAAWVDVGLLIAGAVWAGVATHGFWALKPDTKYHALLLFAVPSFLLVLGATLVERRWRPAIPRWLVGLGDASYSTYLFHELLVVPVIWRAVPDGATPWMRTALSFGLLAVVLVVGYGIHRLVELPMLGGGRLLLGLCKGEPKSGGQDRGGGGSPSSGSGSRIG